MKIPSLSAAGIPRCLRTSILTAALAIAGPAALHAQWATEEFPLVGGWNAIWLSLDCSHDSPDILIDNASISEVWRWERSPSNVQFLEAPSVPMQGDAQWEVWRRGEPAATTLSRLTGNAAYLVKVEDGTAPFAFSLTGKPLAPRTDTRADGLNLVGFP